MTNAEIVNLLDCGITERALVDACKREIELGQTQAKASLRGKLFTEASSGKSPALLHLVKEQSESDSAVQTTELASWLCCTRETVSDMERRGVIEKTGRGTWRLKQSVQRAVTHLRAVAAGRNSGEAGLDLSTERALLARAQREAVEMNNEVARGNLMPREDVTSLFGRAFGAMVKELETLGDRIERDMRVGGEVVEYIRDCVRLTREGMARAADGLRTNR